MLRIANVQLRVRDLPRALGFYVDKLGFVASGTGSGEARLSVTANAAPILQLVEDRKADAPPGDAAGLFHAALLLPDRPHLGAWFRRAVAAGVRFDGYADHGVSEALYFTDPEGNGLEFYADRPAAEWPRDGEDIAMYTRPLDIERLAKTGEGKGMPDGARWGHVHLRVVNLERSEAFYLQKLGMKVTQRSYPGARFLAANGYHHHVGLNTWTRSRQPLPTGAPGLAGVSFILGGAGTSSIFDPDGIRLEIAGG